VYAGRVACYDKSMTTTQMTATVLDLGEGKATLRARRVEDTWTGWPQWFVVADLGGREAVEIGTYVATYPGDALAEAADDLS
jgi:hypothetical protein